MELITPTIINHLASDGRFLYTVDERGENIAYTLTSPGEPGNIGAHSVSGWVNGVSTDNKGRSARPNGWWMELRKVYQ